MSPFLKLRLILLLLLLLAAGLGYGICIFWSTPNSASPSTNSRPQVKVLEEHYKPKRLSDFPQPITVENTEVFLGFDSPNKPATPEEHQAIVRFLNALSQSKNNTRIKQYPFSVADNLSVKVISKVAKRTEFNFWVFPYGIETHDEEVILVPQNLMKLIIYP